MHDTTLQIMGMEVVPADGHGELQFFQAMMLPTPQGVMPLPAGVYRIKIGREALIQHGKAMVELGESLPEEKPQSDLVVASSLAGVDQTLQQQAKLKGA